MNTVEFTSSSYDSAPDYREAIDHAKKLLCAHGRVRIAIRLELVRTVMDVDMQDSVIYIYHYKAEEA